MGFGIPVAAWLRAELRPWAEDLLSPARLKRQGLLDPAFAGRMWTDFLRGEEADAVERQRAASLVAAHPAFAYDRKRCDNPGGYVVDTLQAVFQGFFATENFEDCLIDVVNRGGDADTTGAIAGMLAGARYGLDAIPLRWLNALDGYTRMRCERQAEALLSYIPLQSQSVLGG